MKHLDIQSTSKPLRLARASGTGGTFVTTFGTKFNEYRYTNLSQAVMLASKNRVSFATKHGLKFPALDKDCCYMFHTDMDFDVASISLGVSDEDSCPLQADSSSREPCSGKNVSFKPERVLESSVRFSIWLGAQLPFAFTSSQWWHRSHALGDKVPTVRRCRRQPWWWSSACWD